MKWKNSEARGQGKWDYSLGTIAKEREVLSTGLEFLVSTKAEGGF